MATNEVGSGSHAFLVILGIIGALVIIWGGTTIGSAESVLAEQAGLSLILIGSFFLIGGLIGSLIFALGNQVLTRLAEIRGALTEERLTPLDPKTPPTQRVASLLAPSKPR